MKLRVIPLALAFGLFFGGSILVVALVQATYSPHYGEAFMSLVASVCPGYHLSLAKSTMLAAFVGAGYGLVNGAFCGAVFAWFYNPFVRD